MFALSLAWNADKYRSAEKQIKEVIKAGFSAVELNFRLTEKKVREIYSLKKKGLISVTSCHNYCPVPSGLPVKKALPDYYSLSSRKKRKRLLALNYTKRTIDTAAQLNASAVVLHCGRVEIPDASKHLMRLFAQGKMGSYEFRQISADMRRLREKNSKPYLESVFASIKELSGYAIKRGVKIGLENRIYYPEIPQLEEFSLFLGIPGVFLWYDTGHACVIEKLWSISALEYLNRFSSKLIGVHLHDCLGVRDHLAPGRGEIDFGLFRPFLKQDTIKVIEVHSPATSAELSQSVLYLKKIFD